MSAAVAVPAHEPPEGHPGTTPDEGPGLFWTAVWLVTQTWGGPEEGGWWFDSGELVTDPAIYARLGAFPASFGDYLEAHAHAETMARHLGALNRGRPPKHSATSTGVYETHVFDAPVPPVHWPETPPRYE